MSWPGLLTPCHKPTYLMAVNLVGKGGLGMKSTLIEKNGNRSVYGVVFATEQGACVICHQPIKVGDRVVVRPSGKPEHASPEVCIQTHRSDFIVNMREID